MRILYHNSYNPHRILYYGGSGPPKMDGSKDMETVILGDHCVATEEWETLGKRGGYHHVCVGDHETGACDNDSHRCVFCGAPTVEFARQWPVV